MTSSSEQIPASSRLSLDKYQTALERNIELLAQGSKLPPLIASPDLITIREEAQKVLQEDKSSLQAQAVIDQLNRWQAITTAVQASNEILQVGQYERARQQAEAVRDLHPKSQAAEILLDRILKAEKQARINQLLTDGRIALENQAWAQAMTAFEEVLHLDPLQPNAEGGLERARLQVQTQSQQTMPASIEPDGTILPPADSQVNNNNPPAEPDKTLPSSEKRKVETQLSAQSNPRSPVLVWGIGIILFLLIGIILFFVAGGTRRFAVGEVSTAPSIFTPTALSIATAPPFLEPTLVPSPIPSHTALPTTVPIPTAATVTLSTNTPTQATSPTITATPEQVRARVRFNQTAYFEQPDSNSPIKGTLGADTIIFLCYTENDYYLISNNPCHTGFLLGWMFQTSLNIVDDLEQPLVTLTPNP